MLALTGSIRFHRAVIGARPEMRKGSDVPLALGYFLTPESHLP